MKLLVIKYFNQFMLCVCVCVVCVWCVCARACVCVVCVYRGEMRVFESLKL